VDFFEIAADFTNSWREKHRMGQENWTRPEVLLRGPQAAVWVRVGECAIIHAFDFPVSQPVYALSAA
jgi:hypothetical protein